MTVYLTQWLCPSRHAAFAIPWDDRETTAAEIAMVGEQLRLEHGLGDHCGICGGPIAPEAGRTAWATLEAAMPVLRQAERDNWSTRFELDRLGLTVERWAPAP